MNSIRHVFLATHHHFGIKILKNALLARKAQYILMIKDVNALLKCLYSINYLINALNAKKILQYGMERYVYLAHQNQYMTLPKEHVFLVHNQWYMIMPLISALHLHDPIRFILHNYTTVNQNDCSNRSFPPFSYSSSTVIVLFYSFKLINSPVTVRFTALNTKK